MKLDLSPLIDQVAVQVEETLLAAFPDLFLSVSTKQHDAPLRVSWIDGPSRAAVEALLAPFDFLQGSVSLGEHVFEVSLPAIRFGRALSPLRAALMVGVQVALTGLPPLPPSDVFDEAGVDPSARGPFTAEMLSEFGAAVGIARSPEDFHAFYRFVAAVKETSASLDAASPADALAALPPSLRPAVECFAALSTDQGTNFIEDAAVYAASGGWALASSLVLSK